MEVARKGPWSVCDSVRSGISESSGGAERPPTVKEATAYCIPPACQRQPQPRVTVLSGFAWRPICPACSRPHIRVWHDRQLATPTLMLVSVEGDIQTLASTTRSSGLGTTEASAPGRGLQQRANGHRGSEDGLGGRTSSRTSRSQVCRAAPSWLPSPEGQRDQAAGFVASLRTGFRLCGWWKAPIMHVTCTCVHLARHVWISFKTHKPPREAHKPAGDRVMRLHTPVSANTQSILCAELPGVPGLTAPLSWSPRQALRCSAPCAWRCGAPPCGHGAGSRLSPGRPRPWLPARGENFPSQS